ncbi:hypothetical protein C8F01DRAFT_1377814 [Mycena amicta]|nr:hypothetical protein C8F01DRAFT_1377814 [Mycena amicta]
MDGAPTRLNRLHVHAEPVANPLAESSKAMREMMAMGLDEVTGADFGFGKGFGEGGKAQDDLHDKLVGFGTWDVAETARRLGFEGAESIPTAGEEDEDEILAEILRIADLVDHDPTGIKAATGQNQLPETDAKWFPYPSKLMFLLDFLDNLPRLRLSSALMRMFIFVLKECGIDTIPCRSPMGNIFFMNDVRQIIVNDYANPTTCRLLKFYPEITEDSTVREWYHGSKFCREMDLDTLSPMYDAGRSVHYYVNEVAQLKKNGKYVVPLHWVIFKGEVHANVLNVELDEEGKANVSSTPSKTLVAASDLASDFNDLTDAGSLPTWTGLSFSFVSGTN